MYERKREDAELTAGRLSIEMSERFQVQLSIGHINCLLRQVGLTRRPGRPSRAGAEAAPAPAPQPLANAGLFFR